MFNLDIVYEWIASLPMAGIDVRGLGNLQLDSTVREQPIFQPDINAQVVCQTTRDSEGDESVAKMTLKYTLPYVLLYKPVGTDRDINVNNGEVVARLKTIYEAILTNNNPAIVDNVTVDIFPVNVTFGLPVKDPSGADWYGGKVGIAVMELVN